MADYGLITKNDYGGTQIDSLFQNFILQQERSVTLTFGSLESGEYVASVSIPSSTIPPFIGIRPSTDYYVSILGYTMHNGYYDGMLIVGGDRTVSSSGSYSTNISYIVGRVIASSPSESYGMVVYNSDGKICFHSGYKYLKILSIHSFTIPQYQEPGVYPYIDVYHQGIYNPYYVLMPNVIGVDTVEYTGGPPPNDFSAIVKYSVGIKKLSSEHVLVKPFTFSSWWKQGAPWISPYWYTTFTLLTCTV